MAAGTVVRVMRSLEIFMTAVVFLGAYIIDIIIGDPRWFPHSVVNIGKAVRFLEGKIRPVYGIAFSTFYQYIK